MAKKKNDDKKTVDDDNKKTIEEINKDLSQENINVNKAKKKKVKTLVALILIVIIFDTVVILYYFKPSSDFSILNSTDNIVSGSKCVDGTPEETCSKEKPFFCYKGQLLKKAYTCGCPPGYKIDFQDCKR